MKGTFYRVEIDSLRGISILLVLFYHLGLKSFNSGFIGVDIFFVISGYLITNIILNQKKFSIKKFYEGRIRRLLPALLSMMVIFIPIFFFISSDQILLKEIFDAAKSVLLISSNIFFLNRSGYFDGITQFNPFLHTWSLSIEWQFYLIFPFLIYLLFSYFKINKILIFFLSVIILNILLIQLGGNLKLKYPFVENEFYFYAESVFFNFFSPLSRIWEFIIGSICSLILYRNEGKSLNNNLLLFLGYVLILLSVFIIDSLNFYPNIFTIFPVMGAAIIILYENKHSKFYNLISNKFLTFTGKISYSLYLWHFPLIVIFKIIFFKLNLIILILLVIISYLFSYLSWRFIENPFRNKKNCSIKKLYYISSILIILVISIVYFFQIYQTKNNDFNSVVNQYDFGNSLQKIRDYKGIERNKILTKLKGKNYSSNKEKILIIGDSHADDLGLIINFNNEITKKYEIKIFNIGSYQFSRKNLDDLKKIKYLLNSELFLHADIVVLSDMIFPYKSNIHLKWSLKGIEILNNHTLKYNKKFLITNLSPVFNSVGDPISSLLFRSKFFNKKFSNQDLRSKMYNFIDTAIYKTENKVFEVVKKNDLKIIDKYGLICDRKKEECIFKTNNNDLIFFDMSHITLEGSKFLSQKIDLNIFQE